MIVEQLFLSLPVFAEGRHGVFKVVVAELVKFDVSNNVILLQTGFETVPKLREVQTDCFENSREQQIVLLIVVHVGVDELLEGLHLLAGGAVVEFGTPIYQMEVLDDSQRGFLDIFNLRTDASDMLFAEAGTRDNS